VTDWWTGQLVVDRINWLLITVNIANNSSNTSITKCCAAIVWWPLKKQKLRVQEENKTLSSKAKEV
jgi:hypothetical protein